MGTAFSNVNNRNGFIYMEKIICFKLVCEMSLFCYILSDFLLYLITSRKKSPLNIIQFALASYSHPSVRVLCRLLTSLEMILVHSPCPGRQ